MREKWIARPVVTIFLLTLLALPAWAAPDVPKSVSVRLPVAARAGADTLDPGPYEIDILPQAGGQVLVKFRKPGKEQVLVSVKAVLNPTAERPERNAVKVLFRDGSYYLDKLLVSGEGGFFQFQP